MVRFFVATALIGLLIAGSALMVMGGKQNAVAGTSPMAASSVSQRSGTQISPSPIRRCMNMGGALEAPEEGLWGYTIRDKDFTTLKLAGFDTVRIPIKWSAHTDRTAPYTIDPAFLARVDHVVRTATRTGLQVIINVHHYDRLNDHPERELPRFYAIWDQLIAHYASAPHSVMFEFLNEPHSKMTIARVDELNRNLLIRVRRNDPARWVIMGGGDWGNLSGLVKTDPPYDPRAMVTFHYYSPFEFTHQGAPWAYKKVPLGQVWGTSEDRQAVTRDLSNAARWRDLVGMPMFLGEFGVYEKVPDAQRFLWAHHVRHTSEALGFGWCHWDYATSLGVYDLQTERFKPGVLNALLGQ